MEKWIRSHFEVTPNGWIDGSDCFRFRSADATIEAPIAWFCNTFGSAGVPPTASSLKAVDPDDVMGWNRHFDAWVEQGIIAA